MSNATQKISKYRDTPTYRGAAHPLCFTDEVLDHEFPVGFKPVNIEAYDRTTDPGVWIEDYITTRKRPTNGAPNLAINGASVVRH